MASIIPYPIINGARQSFASVELNFSGTVFTGFKAITYKRTRTRAKLHGNNADPIGKTVGVNEYTAEAEIYLAEYNFFQAQLGPGYGDVFFTTYVTYTTNGFDTIQDTIVGCTIDEVDSNAQQGPDPLVRKIVLNPLKIYFNGVDDNATPLLSIAA